MNKEEIERLRPHEGMTADEYYELRKNNQPSKLQQEETEPVEETKPSAKKATEPVEEPKPAAKKTAARKTTAKKTAERSTKK